VFKRCRISSLLQDVFQQLEITCFQELQYIKKRREIYHIVSSVWVDDQNDDYISSMVLIYRKIKMAITGA
jgi:exportin-7